MLTLTPEQEEMLGEFIIQLNDAIEADEKILQEERDDACESEDEQEDTQNAKVMKFSDAPDTYTNEVRDYPLTDIGLDLQGFLFVDVSVAGFTKEEILVERYKDTLTISSAGANQDDIIEEYFHETIRCSSFKRVINLDDRFNDGKIVSSLNNGILTIMIEPCAEGITEVVEIR